jgi:hypothetical protein
MCYTYCMHAFNLFSRDILAECKFSTDDVAPALIAMAASLIISTVRHEYRVEYRVGHFCPDINVIKTAQALRGLICNCDTSSHHVGRLIEITPSVRVRKIHGPRVVHIQDMLPDDIGVGRQGAHDIALRSAMGTRVQYKNNGNNCGHRKCYQSL